MNGLISNTHLVDAIIDDLFYYFIFNKVASEDKQESSKVLNFSFVVLISKALYG